MGRYEIVVLVSCSSDIEGPYLVEFEYEMSMFDDCMVFDHVTPVAEIGVQMIVSAEDQWAAMDAVERRVQRALRRLGLTSCRTKIVRRERVN